MRDVRRDGDRWALLCTGDRALVDRQAPPLPRAGTEKVTPQEQAAAKNLIEDVQPIGCIRLWKPAPDDPTQMPPDRQPGLAGIYLLTPLRRARAPRSTCRPTC